MASRAATIMFPYPPDVYDVSDDGVFMGFRDLSAAPLDHLWTWAARLRHELFHRAIKQSESARALASAVRAQDPGLQRLADEASAHAAWIEWATDLMDDIIAELAARSASGAALSTQV